MIYLCTYLCIKFYHAIKKFGWEASFFQCFVEIFFDIRDILNIIKFEKYVENVENVKKIRDKAHEKLSFPTNFFLCCKLRVNQRYIGYFVYLTVLIWIWGALACADVHADAPSSEKIK